MNRLTPTLLLLAVFCTGSAYAQGVYIEAKIDPRDIAAKDLSIDGDTFGADLVLPFDIVLKNRRIRCSYDAFECSKLRRFDGKPASDVEIAKGKKAQAEFRALLSGNVRVFIVPRPELEQAFGRDTADVWVLRNGDWIELAKYAEQHGWVRK